jgi:hypothetical protein
MAEIRFVIPTPGGAPRGSPRRTRLRGNLWGANDQEGMHSFGDAATREEQPPGAAAQANGRRGPNDRVTGTDSRTAQSLEGKTA